MLCSQFSSPLMHLEKQKMFQVLGSLNQCGRPERSYRLLSFAGPALATVAIWEMNQWMQDQSLSFCLSNKWLKKKTSYPTEHQVPSSWFQLNNNASLGGSIPAQLIGFLPPQSSSGLLPSASQWTRWELYLNLSDVTPTAVSEPTTTGKNGLWGLI